MAKKRRVVSPNSEICPLCKGEGRIGKTYEVEHMFQNGSVEILKERNGCHACMRCGFIVKGSYRSVWIPKKKRECSSCKGTGKREEKEVATRYAKNGQPASWRIIQVTCTWCDGEGRRMSGGYYDEKATPDPNAIYEEIDESELDEGGCAGIVLGLIIAAILAYLYYVKVIL